jgi:hypothetical protein
VEVDMLMNVKTLSVLAFFWRLLSLPVRAKQASRHDRELMFAAVASAGKANVESGAAAILRVRPLECRRSNEPAAPKAGGHRSRFGRICANVPRTPHQRTRAMELLAAVPPRTRVLSGG